MSDMGTGTLRDAQGGWAEAGRRLTAATYAPVVTAAVLALLADRKSVV